MRILSGTMAGIALCTAALASPAFAQDNGTPKIDLDAQLILQYYLEDNTDLSSANDEQEHSLSEQLKVTARAHLSDDLIGFAHVRALNTDGDAGFDDEDSGVNSTAEDSFLELRELYLEKMELFSVIPLSLQVGRQRVKEPRSLWWNSDNDLVRINYDSTLLSGFIAAGENLGSYRTSDGDFNEDDENRFRTLGEVSWQYRYGQFLEGRFLYEDDHSGLESPGTIIANNDRDNEDQNVVWLGVRAKGDFGEPMGSSSLKYRADLIGVVGDEDALLSTANAGTNTRTVTGSRSRDVEAWAFDGGITADPGKRGGILVLGGYAYGSGDDDPTDDTDEEFRQTDMQGTSSRMGLERTQQKNYGEVLRPELANLHILNAGAAYPVTDATDVSLTYFNYHLAEDDTSLRSSGISAPLNGTDDFVGEAVDFIFNIDIDDEFSFVLPFGKDLDFKAVAGAFFPGDAYSPNDSEEAFRIFTELKLRF